MATTDKQWINEELTKIAKEFGYTEEKAKVRDYTDNRGFYAIIEPENGDGGEYKDLSFVFTPFFKNNSLIACVVSLGIGSSGFENDRGLAHKPGTRRVFKKLKSINSERTWLKTSFEETTSFIEELNDACNQYPEWKAFEASYNSHNKGYLPACTLIIFDNKTKQNNKPSDWLKQLKIIKAWLATYANLRKWAPETKTNPFRKKIDDALKDIKKTEDAKTTIDDIKSVLNTRKFVVLQGAPGTGKTWTAMKIAQDYKKGNVFFTQFHAETSYSDFVWGIKPILGNNNSKDNDKGKPQFQAQKGPLLDAIEKAESNREQNKTNPDPVLLIIDEINRANLPNVLGPVFYLFEPLADNRKDVTIKIGDKNYKKLPENLYVIATMNTADRSLAVVDFALRRRFAWYTLKPHKLTDSECGGKKFYEAYYDAFAKIFEEFANDEELNLQPGQSYFIVNKKDSEKCMKERMRYELMPLIKEYLASELLLDAKDRFYNLFLMDGIELFE